MDESEGDVTRHVLMLSGSSVPNDLDTVRLPTILKIPNELAAGLVVLLPLPTHDPLVLVDKQLRAKNYDITLISRIRRLLGTEVLVEEATLSIG